MWSVDQNRRHLYFLPKSRGQAKLSIVAHANFGRAIYGEASKVYIFHPARRPGDKSWPWLSRFSTSLAAATECTGGLQSAARIINLWLRSMRSVGLISPRSRMRCVRINSHLLLDSPRRRRGGKINSIHPPAAWSQIDVRTALRMLLHFCN
jgi:hypothetical protein